MTRHRPWPARASSAIPPRIAADSARSAATDDPVVIAGRLWEEHCGHCPLCTGAAPGCRLGGEIYDVYVWLASGPPPRDAA